MVNKVFFFVLFVTVSLPFVAGAQSYGNVEVNLDVLAPRPVEAVAPTAKSAETVDDLRRKYGLNGRGVLPAVTKLPVPAKAIPVPLVKQEFFVKEKEPIPAPPATPVRIKPAVIVEDIAPPLPASLEKELSAAVEVVDGPVVQSIEDLPEVVVVQKGGDIAPADIRGLMVGAIEFTYDGLRLTDKGQAQIRANFIPVLQAQAAHRIGLYAYAASEGRGDKKARRLSLSRALQLRDFLVREGIAARRIDLFPQGFDGGTPADRVEVILQK